MTILLVEDDPSLRRLAERLLGKLGYTVRAAGDAVTAEAQCRECPEEITLLITDVFMPDIGGPELAARLLAIRPGMKVLYVSGNEEVLQDPRARTHGANFLQKPYTHDDMSRKIREVLGE